MAVGAEGGKILRRNRRIAKRVKAGEPLSALAKEYELSKTQIRRIAIRLNCLPLWASKRNPAKGATE